MQTSLSPSSLPPGDALSARRAMRKTRIVTAFADASLSARVSTHLQGFYQAIACKDLPSAIAACRRHQPDVVLAGEDLRPSNGFDFVRLVRMDPSLARVHTVILVDKDDQPTRDSVTQCGAHAHLLMSCAQQLLLTAIAKLVNRNVERAWAGLPPLQRQALTSTVGVFNRISDVIARGDQIPYAGVRDACQPLVQAIGNSDYKNILRGVRDHDDYSYAHSLRVATLLAVFGYNLGLSRDEQLILATGGLLHDVGKMLIPTEVLNKPGRLTQAEFAVMKGHVEASIAYLQACDDLPRGILTIAAQHHEKLDGTGYPKGLNGRQLNDLARMASIVDVFSALTDRRVYKPAMDPEKALTIMTEMGSHLDQKLLRLFRHMLLDTVRDTILLEA